MRQPRLFSILFIFVLLLTLLPVQAQAAESDNSPAFYTAISTPSVSTTPDTGEPSISDPNMETPPADDVSIPVDTPAPDSTAVPDPAAAPAAFPRLNTDSHAKFMSGGADGCFWPDEPLSRGSAALILYNLFQEKPQSSRTFPDVPADAWCAQAAGVLTDLGLLQPDADGAFRPSAPITRADFAVMICRFLPMDTGHKTFPDVPLDNLAYDAIGAVGARNLLTADDNGNFRPEESLTRAEGATAFIRLLRHYPDVEAIYAARDLRIFADVPHSHWAYYYIMEATTTHTVETGPDGNERWTSTSPDVLPLADGCYRRGDWLYRVQDGRFLYRTSADGFTFDADGRYTTGNAELDQLLNTIVEEQTNETMSRDEKLRALFNYVRDNYTYLSRPHVAKGQTGWEAEYALEFLQKGKGNCFSFAATYYELVRELGLDANTVVGVVGSVNHRPHGWVEIRLDDGNYVFDTELEMAYRRKGVYGYDLFKKTYSTLPFYYGK